MAQARFKLSKGQLERTSEITGNISVAWFSGGVISLVLFHPQTVFDFGATFVLSLVMFIAFFIIALNLAKETRK